MGINIIGKSNRDKGERKNWIARVLIEGHTYVSSNWSEHSGHSLSWGNWWYRHYDLELYDHPEEIDIFCMADGSQLTMTKGSIWGTPTGPTWINPDTKESSLIFPMTLNKDGDTQTKNSSESMAIFDSDPDWNDSIVKYMYVEKFNARTGAKLTNVKKWHTLANPKNALYHQENERLNFCIFDMKRCTFISSLAELRQRATEYGVTHLYGTADGNKYLRPLRFMKFKATKSHDKHNHYYYKCEEAPPKISITGVGGSVSDPTAVELKITVTEDTTTARKTGVKDFTYSIEKDGKTFIKKDAVESAPSGIYTAKLEITDTPFTAYGDYEISVTARDNVLNTATGTHQMSLVVPPMSCVEWPGNPGLSNRVGVEHDNYKAITKATPSKDSSWILMPLEAKDGRKWGDYTATDARDILRHGFYEDEEKFKGYNYFVLYGSDTKTLVQLNGFTSLATAESYVTANSAKRLITFGFCKAGAEEGPSDWVNQPIPLGDVDDNCPNFPGNTGVDASFLKGKKKDLIDPAVATPTIDSNNVANGIAEFKDSSKSSSELLAGYSYEVIQDYLYHSASKFKWNDYKYFFIVSDVGAGTGRQLVQVFGAKTIKELQKVPITPFVGKTCYSFGYCDSRPGFSSGASTEAPPKPAELQFDQVEFSNGISGEKSKRKILRIIDEIILGNAFAVSPELVPNMSWAWKAAGKIQNAMAVSSGAFFNYLGHYIAPDGALRGPFGLGFGPFANDLIKSVDNVETSSPAPLSFGGLEPKEDTNKRVVRYVASSRLNNAKARVNAAPAPAISPGISAQARHSINSKYVNPQGKADNSISFHTANEPVYINGTLQRFQGGIPGASYSMDQLLKDYDVDDETQLINCTSSSSVYNRDLHEDFQKFDTYSWEGKWGDDTDRFQTAVEFKITIKANNDRGKSDAGISFSGINERATNDTECWGKIWIGDTKDYEKTDATAKLPANFQHQKSHPHYPHVYEFYNPHFSTGKIGFGNGAKSTRTFLVRIDRKPHEEELTIFTKGYIKGNRRGELSPKSFIPKAEKIFDFAKDLCSLFDWIKWLNISETIPIIKVDIEINPYGWFCKAFKGIEDILNGFFQPIIDLINDFFNILVTSIFGFMFALMNENYRETYHSTIEFEVEENKIYESKFENEDVERHPATRYFDSMETPLAYLYTQYHFPFTDLNRFKVYAQKYYPTIPFMGNELVTGRSLSNTRVYKKNRYFVANLFRLTYETNIGVIYEYLLRQNDVASPSTEIDYNIKLSGRKTVEKSDDLIQKQQPCVFDLILPSDLTDIANLVKEQGGGLGTKSCYDGGFDSLISDAAVPAKLDSSNKTKRLTLAGYADVYSKYGNKIDPNGTSGSARIAEINKIIGEFSDIEGKLGEIDSDGYKLSTWTAHCASEFVGLGVNMTAPNTNSLIGFVQGAPGATAKTPPTYSVTVGGTTLTGTVKKDAPSTNPKAWDWGSLTQVQIAQTNFPAFNETTYTIVTAPSYTKDGIQYDYNTPNPGWNINMTASTATPRNLVYKIIEFILWYLQPNGIAQTTRLSASALYEYEKLMQADIDSYDPTGPEDPNAKEPIIINGELYERRC